jgi:hypothetical protein
MILSDKGLKQRDLTNIARVDKRTHSITFRHLYRRVKIYQGRKYLDLFNRSLSELPQIAAITKSLVFKIHVPDANNESLVRTTSILEKVSALQSLAFQFRGYHYRKASSFLQRFTSQQLNSNAAVLAHLECIEISDAGLTFADIFSLILLPKIQRLVVGWNQTEQSNSVVISPSITAHQPSLLKDLAITTYYDCSDELHAVISACPALESFSCYIGPMFNINDPQPSPSGLSRVLSFRKETIVTMHLNCHRSGNIDESRVDLSGFDKVKFLKISSLLLFDYDERYQPALRSGLYNRLPSKLERLEV